MTEEYGEYLPEAAPVAGDSWGTPTLDQPEYRELKFSEVSQDPTYDLQIMSGREIGLAATSDNTAILHFSTDRPGQWKRLLPGQTYTAPERFDRVYIKRDTANGSTSAKYVLAVAPRPGMLQFSTTPTPTVTVTASGTGASATQVQGTAAEAAAMVGNPLPIAGKDASGNLQVPTAVAGGQPATLTSKGLAIVGSDGTNARVLSIGPTNGAVASPNVLVVGGWDGTKTWPIGFDAVGNMFARVMGQANEAGSLTGLYPVAVGGKDASGNARGTGAALPTSQKDATLYRLQVEQGWVGTNANLWNNVASGVNGLSATIDTLGAQWQHIGITVSALTNIFLQGSQDGTNWYEQTAALLAFGGAATQFSGVNAASRYVRFKSSANVTITATLMCKH